MFIIRSKYKKIMDAIVTYIDGIIIDEDMVMSCFDNGWTTIVSNMIRRRVCDITKFKTNEAIITVINLGNDTLRKRIILNPELKFYTTNIDVMVYILKRDMVELFSYIIYNTDIDFSYNDYHFIKVMIKYNSKNIVRYMIKDTTFLTNDMRIVVKTHCTEILYNEVTVLLLSKKVNRFRQMTI